MARLALGDALLELVEVLEQVDVEEDLRAPRQQREEILLHLSRRED